jgi:hypothetical protein
MVSIGGLLHLVIFGCALGVFLIWSKISDWLGYFLARYPTMTRFWAALSLLELAVCMILAPSIFGLQELSPLAVLISSFFVATELVTASGVVTVHIPGPD